MNHLHNSKFELYFKDTNNNNIHMNIDKELFRGDLYCYLLKQFTKSCLHNLNESIFSHKKNYTRTITNLLSSWFFTLYQTCDFSFDDFFPNNYKDNDIIIKRILIDYCSLCNIDNLDSKINNIINDLYTCYNSILDKLVNYTKKNNNLVIYKTENNYDRNNKKILFYNFNILNTNNNICNKLSNIINNIMIPVEQYNEMKNRYEKYNDNHHDNHDIKENNIDILIWIILFRYQLLSSNNNQLAVIPSIINNMVSDFNLSIECFASAINSSLDNFCSIYYDVEKYFGSIGNFFNIKPISGVYSFNPPYQYDIISNGIIKIINHMDDTDKNLAFIITIPIWDNEGKQIMLDNNMENNNNIIKYNDFEIMTTIRQSKYFKGLRMISKDNFTYMDHNFYLFKNKTIQNTYVIIMSNFDNNFIDIINKYNFYN
jgi:hypothetical protein